MTACLSIGLQPTAVCIANRPAGSSGLDELQGHAVALADGLVLGAVLVLERIGRRQCPDAFGVVSAVLGVGIDLAAPREFEASRFGKADHRGLVHIAAAGLGILRPRRWQAVFLDAEHAAGLQRLEGRIKHGLGAAAAHPVVHIAEGQHRIGAAGRGDIEHALGRVEGRDLDLAVDRHRVHLGLEANAAGIGGIELALFAQIRREDLGIPAPTRGELHDGVAGLDAEEAQRFIGVAMGVASDVADGAVVGRDGGLERIDGLGLCTNGGQHDGCCEQSLHGAVSPGERAVSGPGGSLTKVSVKVLAAACA
mmetsp:Transcript_61164/g.144495  ORF Transcript_61164/g.144495 Transcript_61164/m.144495 type:complete len:309 (-) Transcript_61164:4595-5521(-)